MLREELGLLTTENQNLQPPVLFSYSLVPIRVPEVTIEPDLLRVRGSVASTLTEHAGELHCFDVRLSRPDEKMPTQDLNGVLAWRDESAVDPRWFLQMFGFYRCLQCLLIHYCTLNNYLNYNN